MIVDWQLIAFVTVIGAFLGYLVARFTEQPEAPRSDEQQ